MEEKVDWKGRPTKKGVHGGILPALFIIGKKGIMIYKLIYLFIFKRIVYTLRVRFELSIFE